jgi:hypothetical protein
MNLLQLVPTTTKMSSDDETHSFYDLRKQPHMQLVKGISSKGKTVRACSNKDTYCVSCDSDTCEHAKAQRLKFTDNSRIQKKNVHKCDCCSDTHICEHLIPVRGRTIKPDVDTT